MRYLICIDGKPIGYATARLAVAYLSRRPEATMRKAGAIKAVKTAKGWTIK